MPASSWHPERVWELFAFFFFFCGSILALNSQGAAGFHASLSSLGADTGKFAKKHPNTSPNCFKQSEGALPLDKGT